MITPEVEQPVNTEDHLGFAKLVKAVTGKRLPRSTARRRGLLLNDSGRGNVRNRSVMSLTNGFKRETNLNVDDDVSLVNDDSSGDHDVNEDALNGSNSEGDDSGDEAENGDTNLIVNDDWHPEVGEKWEDENDHQQKRIYKKGEMYLEYEFGKITIKPRKETRCGQFFEVMRGVGRDYMHKSNGHLKMGIKDFFQEDIRENNDILAKSLDNYFLESYGVLMTPSTLYRIRSKSFVEIHGGNNGGVLLSAIALDENDEIYPVAWAIVGSEDEKSWMLFMHHMKKLLEPARRGDQWCIIYDRQKRRDNALSRLWPAASRRYCCKHLSENFKIKFSGLRMWSFNRGFSEVNPAVRIWLADLGEQCRWTQHKSDASIKFDVNKTNFVESFNATLAIDRCRPVMTLLEGIRRVKMVRLASRREPCEKWQRSDICQNIVRRVQMLDQESR
ncbi:Halomucin [Bienertia sinuspersici]